MVKTIRLLLEYGCSPVWLYDEEGGVIDTRLPDELRNDTELDANGVDTEQYLTKLFSQPVGTISLPFNT